MSLGFVFPGQGSQSVGMLGELAANQQEVKDTFVEASDALGIDLWKLTQDGPEEELNQTQITQPAMLTAGVAVWRAWLANGGKKPGVMAGHSLGEYSALVCADALAFADAVTLVADRGRFMQEAVPVGQGGMAAIIGLDDDAVAALCQQASEGDVLSPVNFNAPGQVVIAGSKAAVDRAVEQSKAAGAKRAIPLPVSVPSHCALMAPAAEKMRARLSEITINAPTIPVIHNVHVQSESDADAIRDALVKQIESPVRWVETINKIASDGVLTLVESGPGKVLAGLNRRINKETTTLPVFDVASLQEAIAATR
ncbi:MAG: malonyl CoA-ACP transacylase [Acidithiobacillales bacterium SG8_45]|jgi:[acyl-carrier-protein] S-malonyltransferase|nr:MAG: malonyl CoA-ACP transacylase [Acidithiobacillales bacterium SG8_45]